ncbi:hypothetical protein VPH35_129838 [Triticum aestivum]
MEKNKSWCFNLPTADQLSEWMLTEKYMIDDISSSQGFISAVEHKTREVARLCSHYILARWDGWPMDEHHVTPLISEHLHLPYQPYLYAPYDNESRLVLDLMNEPTTAYARVVLSSGVTMAVDGTEVLCYPVKNVGVPMEAIPKEVITPKEARARN